MAAKRSIRSGISIKIEKKKPLPDPSEVYTRRKKGAPLIDWDLFGVNDSAEIPPEKFKIIYASCVKYQQKTKKEFLFLREGTRVWRVR